MSGKRGAITTTGLAIAVFAALAVLAYFPLSQTSIDLEAQSESVSLVVGADDVELPPMILEQLNVLGRGIFSDSNKDSDFRSYVKFSPIKPGASGAAATTIQLSGLVLPAGSTMRLRKYGGEAGSFEIMIASPGAELPRTPVFVQGTLALSVDGRETGSSFPSLTPLSLKMSDGQLVVRFVLSKKETRWNSRRPFGVSMLGFRDAGLDGELGSLFSAISRAKVQFHDVETVLGNPRQLEFGPRQMLQMGRIVDGYVSELAIRDDHLFVSFSGAVTSLRTTWKSVDRDHMPSWLAWLLSFDLVKEGIALAGGLAALILQIWPWGGRR